jgi:hypothetical protein
MRTWKEKTWGFGGDPRLGLMLIMERDRIRDEYYKPILEQRKSLRSQRNMLKDRNHKIAQTMRNSKMEFRDWGTILSQKCISPAVSPGVFK